jgi:uncharacterized membrane protein
MKVFGILIVYLPLVMLLIALALPPAIRERSWRRFFIAAVLSFFGMVLPLLVFTASIMLGPEWKGDCRHGWIDCFYVGKLALLPLVLWATASLYAVEIYRTSNRTQPWIVLGVLTGAITSTFCVGMVVFIMPDMPRELMLAWLVPLYISLWYMIRAWQLLKTAGTNLKSMGATLLGNAFFWIASVIWSRTIFTALPDLQPTDCFIATAAMRGHSTVVGPCFRVRHHGKDRKANQQLLTLWQLEDFWRQRAPRSHARFRRFYNVMGPVVASCLTAPFLADLAYLAIKPVEIMGMAILTKEQKRQANQTLELTSPRSGVQVSLAQLYRSNKAAPRLTGPRAEPTLRQRLAEKNEKENMTARQKIESSHVWLRRSFVSIVFGLLAGWAIAASLPQNKWAMGLCISFFVSSLFLTFVILPIIYVCPSCGNRLSPLSLYGFNGSAFRLPQKVRFCPCCGLDFDKDLA